MIDRHRTDRTLGRFEQQRRAVLAQDVLVPALQIAQRVVRTDGAQHFYTVGILVRKKKKEENK